MAALVTDQRVMNSDNEESRKYLLWLTTKSVNEFVWQHLVSRCYDGKLHFSDQNGILPLDCLVQSSWLLHNLAVNIRHR